VVCTSNPRDKNGTEIHIGDRVEMPLDFCHFGQAVVTSIYPDMIWAKDDRGQSHNAAAKTATVLKPHTDVPTS
jgi:hypothetical protein